MIGKLDYLHSYKMFQEEYANYPKQVNIKDVN